MRISDWSSDVCSSDLRLAEPRRAIEKHMVERIGARLRRLDEDAHILPRRRLPDDFGERFGAQRRVGILGGADGGGEGRLGPKALLHRRRSTPKAAYAPHRPRRLAGSGSNGDRGGGTECVNKET